MVIKEVVVCPHCGYSVGYNENSIHRYFGIGKGGLPFAKEWILCTAKGCGQEITLRSW